LKKRMPGFLVKKKTFYKKLPRLHNEVAIFQQDQVVTAEKMEFVRQQFTKEKEELQNKVDSLCSLQGEVQKLQGEKAELAQKTKSYEQALKLLYVQLKASKEKTHSIKFAVCNKSQQSSKSTTNTAATCRAWRGYYLRSSCKSAVASFTTKPPYTTNIL